MADLREKIESPEEALETVKDAARASVRSAYPVKVSEDTEHGHVVNLQPLVKHQYSTPEGETKSEDMTLFKDVPIRFQRGGGVVATHPVKKDDIGYWVPNARDFSPTMKDGGSQDPGSGRVGSLADGYFTSGFRTDKDNEKVMGKEGKRYAKDSHQLRSDDGKHVSDLHPGEVESGSTGDTGSGGSSGSASEDKSKKAGFTTKSVSKDDKEEDNPFANAKTFYERTTMSEVGVQRRSVKDKDGKSIQHEYMTTHDDGHKTGVGDEEGPRMHSTDLHPSTGYKTDIKRGKHSTKLHPDEGYKTQVENEKHYHSMGATGGNKLSANDGKQTFTMDSGKITSKADEEVTHDAPKTRSTNDHDVDGNLHAKKDISSDQNISAQQTVSGLMGAFGGMGGQGGGTMGSNTSGANAGATSGVGAGALAENAAAYNVGELGGDLDGTLPNPSVVSAAAGMAAANVGTLGGDLSGTLPNPNVVGLAHVDASALPTTPGESGTLYLYDDGTRLHLCVSW
jgi:hypothetical protein